MNFDPSSIVYGAAAKNKNNSSKTIPMTVRVGERISMQLSSSVSLPCTAMWKPSLPPQVENAKDADKKTLDAIISDPNVLDTLRSLDAHNISYCVANSASLFSQELTSDAVRVGYTPIVKTRDGVDFVRLRIPLEGGEPHKTAIIVVDREENGVIHWHPGTIDDIERGSKFIAVAESYGMYIISAKNFGMTLSVTNIMVWPGAKSGTAHGVGCFELGVTFVETSKEDHMDEYTE